MITINQWKLAKDLYEETRPIRGTNIRPLNNRRKKHHAVELFDSDKQIYSFKLYDTHVLKFYPDGKVGVNIDSKDHHTRTTAEFISDYAWYLRAVKRNNRLWIMCADGNWPMPDSGELLFEPHKDTTRDAMQVAHKVYAEKKVINRQRAKEAREPYRKFIEFGKSLLTLSDGWVMPETIAQFCSYEMWDKSFTGTVPTHARYNLSRILDIINEGEDSWLEAFVYVTMAMTVKESDFVPFDTGLACKCKYGAKQFSDFMFNRIEEANDVHDIIEVEANGTFTHAYI